MPTPVLHLIYSLVAGGAETLTAQLAEGQRGGAFAPAVLAWRLGGPVEGRLRSAGVPVAILTAPRWLRAVLAPAWTMLVALRVAAAARAHRARIIHAHMGDSAIVAALAAPLCNCRVVATHHGTHLVPIELGSGWASRLRLVLTRWAYRRAGRIIAVSPAVADRLIELGLEPARIRTVVNGVPDPAPARPRGDVRRDLGIAAADAPVAVCVGRLAAGKGQDRLAAIWPQVRAAVPGAVLLLVGDGPLRSQIAGDGIVLAGVRSDIGDVLAASDAFVTASQGEGISLAVLEALVRGLPVVSTACAGNREVLADGAGLLVPLGDDAALATAIARVLGEPATAARLGAAARDRAHGRFRLADTISATADVYRELVPA